VELHRGSKLKEARPTTTEKRKTTRQFRWQKSPVSMSSTQTASSAASGTETKATKSTLSPVGVFDTPLAKGISFGRIATLLGLLALRMDALITDPVTTLKTLLPVVAAIQVAYAVLCIPVAGTQLSKASKKARPGERKKADNSGPNPISVRFP